MTRPTLELLNDVPAARNGDRAAFARLVKATQRTVTSIALAITRDLAASEDIAQETFLAAWQRLDRLRDAESLLPWLREVARNRAIDYLRHSRHREASVDDADARADDTGLDPASALAHDQDRRLLARALERVPDDSREVLLLFYREGQRSRYVADLLGLSDAAVRKRLQRARAALQQELRATADAAKRTAPGIAFTTMVVAGLGSAPGAAGASTALGTAGKMAGKAALGVVGALFAALALVGSAMWWELRRDLARAMNERERRQAYRFAIKHGALMTGFIGTLGWARYADWSGAAILTASAAFSLLVLVLALMRFRERAGRRPPSLPK